MMFFANDKSCLMKRSIANCTVFFLAIGLGGCADNDVRDLTKFINEVKARPKGIIQPLPEIKVVEPFIFDPENLRDPFRAIEKVQVATKNDISLGTGVRPDTTRRREELEGHSLDTLRMVGTLNMKNDFWALIKANDGTVHKVKKGNYMGQNYGEIIRVLNDKIELMEIVADGQGTWREQQASLVLTE